MPCTQELNESISKGELKADPRPESTEDIPEEKAEVGKEEEGSSKKWTLKEKRMAQKLRGMCSAKCYNFIKSKIVALPPCEESPEEAQIEETAPASVQTVHHIVVPHQMWNGTEETAFEVFLS